MRDKTVQMRLCGLLLILNLCFIWGNSLLPAEASQAFSDSVRELLASIHPGSGGNGSGSALVRKIAHFTEFMSLGLLLNWQLRLRGKGDWLALPWGFAAACLDEGIQFFVPGRSPGMLDVGIDTCGVLTGMLLLQIGYRFIRKIQTHYGG